MDTIPHLQLTFTTHVIGNSLTFLVSCIVKYKVYIAMGKHNSIQYNQTLLIQGKYLSVSFRCDGSNKDFAPPCYTIQPFGTRRCINFARSAIKCQIENGRLKTREQLNANTAFIDGSQIYGSTREVAESLRDRTSEYP